MQAIDTGFTIDFTSQYNQTLLNRLKEAGDKFIKTFPIDIPNKEYWKYFAYVAHSGICDGYISIHSEWIDGFNQFLVAKKDQTEKVIYYWHNSKVLKDILQYSKIVNENELDECKFCILFDDRNYGRAMKGNTRIYSLKGIEQGIEYFEKGWDIYYEAYYNHEFVNENNFMQIFEE